jgi:hypothetical protein
MRTWPGERWSALRGPERRKVLAFVLGAACCLTSWRQAAAEPARVLVIAPPESRLERRLAAEIGNLGLVALVGPQPVDASEALSGEVLATAGAAAAVRVAASADALEIWVSERETGRVVLRETVLGLGEGSAEDVAVLRTGELLRANLANLIDVEPSKPAPPQPESARPAAAPAEVVRSQASPTEAAARWVVAAGPTLLVGLSARPGALAGLGFEPRGGYAVDVWVAWAAADSVQSTAGSAAISPRHLGVGAVRLFGAPRARWRLALGGTAAVQWLYVTGRGLPGYVAGSDDHVTAALLGRGWLAYAPLPRLRFALDLHAGATWQRTRIRLAGVDVATWGRALALASLRAEVLW